MPTVPPVPLLHRSVLKAQAWMLPFLLSLIFVLSVAAWLEWSDRAEVEESQRVLISDALSLESQLTARIEAERMQLQMVAAQMSRATRGAANEPHLSALAGVNEGLRRTWISLTWIDAQHRIVQHLPPVTSGSTSPPSIDNLGISAHITAPLSSPLVGQLIVRFAPAALLRSSVPWWLASKYEVRLVDGEEQVLATTSDPPSQPQRQSSASHRISLEPSLNDTWLELIARSQPTPWWRTLPPVLMVVFLALVGLATWLLRQQMAEVSRAEVRWRTEAAWRQAMEDSLTVGLRARDLEGRLIYANRSFCNMVGYSAEHLLGLRPPMPYWAPDHLEETMWHHHRNMAGGAPREGYESHWRHRDGRALNVLVFEAPLVDAQGRHIGWMASALDITERKRLEDLERRQRDALAHQARLTTLGEIASALAHELNQPLTVIRSDHAGIQRRLQKLGFNDAPVLAALQRQGEQAAQAGQVVQRIRAFLTRREPQPEPCDLTALARHALGLIQHDLARQRIDVSWDLPATAAQVMVMADPVLIEQVLINLIRNASDAPQTRQITLRLRPDGGFARLQVEDDGTGLGGRSIETLCAPFHSTKAEGMGMGLAICRSIIEAHHGAMDAGQSPSGGAMLAFTLPLAALASQAPTSTP
ncbi:MAG: sensor histidine kinase [Leptothrix ochracea]